MMKYMGSKLGLLENGLGETLLTEVDSGARFVDLFSGTGRVAWHVAEAVDVPVLAVDLQYYAVVLAGAVIERDDVTSQAQIVETWLHPAENAFKSVSFDQKASLANTKEEVLEARELCRSQPGGPVWTSYGGHYFSPSQARMFDILLEEIPQDNKCVARFCKALLVMAASRCAAAPGHTAQPFQPTEAALPYISVSWQRDPMATLKDLLPRLAQRHALRKGTAMVADANELVEGLNDGDVVFVDPPYSAVHYSRFYHVLETVARGKCGPVSGVGRYPPTSERPRSAYSIKSQALGAMLELLERLSINGCRVILTFPSERASNGMKGRELVEYARQWFNVEEKMVTSRFSTLGGNGRNRRSRRSVGELVAVMRPYSG